MSNRLKTVFSKLGIRVFVKGALMMGGLIFLGYLINQVDFEETFRAFDFSNNPEAGLLNGRTGFFLLAAAITTVGGPRQVVSFFAAYFFGLWEGAALALAGTAVGCTLSYFFARIFRRQVSRFVQGRVGVAFDFWRDNPFSLTLIIRLLPVGSNMLTNLAAGAGGLPLPFFLLGSVVGYIPQTFVFAVMGSGVNLQSGVQIAMSVLLFAISAILGFYLYARYRKSVNHADAGT